MTGENDAASSGAVRDARRLAALARIELLDTAPEESFDRLTRLAARVLRTPVALMSLVDGDRQFFKSVHGSGEPWASTRETPLLLSFCQHVVGGKDPLVVHDARRDPRFREHPAVDALGVVAYLGVPLALRDGTVLGAFCVVDSQPRRWRRGHADLLRDLCGSMVGEIELRLHVLDVARAQRAAQRSEETLEHYARELEASDRRKDEFLAVLGHELRNPLAAISATAELLALGPDDADDVRWAGRTITEQVSLLTSLLDDLLDVSRIGRGKIKLRRATSEVAAIVGKATQTAGPFVEARRHRMAVAVEPGLHARVDPTRLEQVVVNLVTNAAKYTDPGGHIEVDAWADGADLRLRVRDDGPGIPPGMQSAIFEPFRQAAAGEAYPGGLGIGLTLVKRLVELHGGTVTLVSGADRPGSEFTVHLPDAVRAAPPEPAVDDAEEPSGTAPRRLRILVVDDNRHAADGVARLLARDGHETRTVYCGLDAVTEAGATEFDVLLVDIALPDIDGYEVARRVRGHRERDGPTLVALSGFGHPQARASARDAGFDHHLAKPASLEKLRALLGD